VSCIASHRLPDQRVVLGMYHRTGAGTETSYVIDALEQWIFDGHHTRQHSCLTPDEWRRGSNTRTVPASAVATFKGEGSPDDAVNFVCKAASARLCLFDGPFAFPEKFVSHGVAEQLAESVRGQSAAAIAAVFRRSKPSGLPCRRRGGP
jgi:hypothetical protein